MPTAPKKKIKEMNTGDSQQGARKPSFKLLLWSMPLSLYAPRTRTLLHLAIERATVIIPAKPELQRPTG
jgi:hypothetical protein